MSHEAHYGHGGETPEQAIIILLLCFLVFPIMLQKNEETLNELTGMAGGHY